MKIVLDMNLSPAWVEILEASGHTVKHWANIGPANAEDETIFDWAFEHGFTIITLDLDFGALLAFKGSSRPSVIQVRREDVSPGALQKTLVGILRRYSQQIEDGALIVIDESKARLRLLPLR